MFFSLNGSEFGQKLIGTIIHINSKKLVGKVYFDESFILHIPLPYPSLKEIFLNRAVIDSFNFRSILLSVLVIIKIDKNMTLVDRFNNHPYIFFRLSCISMVNSEVYVCIWLYLSMVGHRVVKTECLFQTILIICKNWTESRKLIFLILQLQQIWIYC